jgi:hypothetical protein
MSRHAGSAHGPVFRTYRTGPPTAVEAPGIRSGDPAGSARHRRHRSFAKGWPMSRHAGSADGPVFHRHRIGPLSAVETPGIHSGDRAGTQDPSPTVGTATAPVTEPR